VNVNRFANHLRGFAYIKMLYLLASVPSAHLTKMTQTEITALRLFRDRKFANAPHMLKWSRMDVHLQDVQYMPGGYMAIMFMTKLPADQIK
jgi:hypothetical protein